MKSSGKSLFSRGCFRYLVPVTIILFLSTTLLYSFYGRSDSRNDIILRTVVQFTASNHVNPVPMDAQFSEKVFDAYLKLIDRDKLYLTKEDIRQMEVYKRQLGDQITNGTYQLYDLSVRLIEKRLPEVQEYYREILSQPFTFTANETWEADVDKRDRTANSAELKEAWRKMLKWRVIMNVANALRAQENETDPEKIKSMETIEANARERVLNNFNDVMNNLPHRRQEGMFPMYINAIMSVFDPNTEYYTPRDREDFDIRISGQLEGIGAQLRPIDGYARVERLVPGSPSWLQGELRVNDQITKVKQEDEDDAVDIFGMDLQDAVRLIRGPKGTKVTLTVRRDGVLHEITITRDIVIDEEGYAKSAVLTDPATNVKVGYIELPSFYIDFNRTATGRASSTDVGKEIEKLKNDGVDGIIIDLRTNTGGALDDAIIMGGMFISTGPIVQVKGHSREATVLSENRPNIHYDGPLVILVNALSASASEIFAAAMQDYKRAVVIGSSSTFGKGTVQHVQNLDNFMPASIRPAGSLRLTISKFYRITGGSVQLKGVESDIVLPDITSGMRFGAQYEDNHLDWTIIDAANFTTWKNPAPVEMLRQKSMERTSKSNEFNLLSQQIDFIMAQRENTHYSLNLNTYQEEERKRREESARFNDESRQVTAISIAATAADVAEMAGDTAKIARSNSWIKDLNKDIFLEEAVKVVGDWR